MFQCNSQCASFYTEIVEYITVYCALFSAPMICSSKGTYLNVKDRN